MGRTSLMATVACCLLGACAATPERASVAVDLEELLAQIPAEEQGPIDRALWAVEDARELVARAREEARQVAELHERAQEDHAALELGVDEARAILEAAHAGAASLSVAAARSELDAAEVASRAAVRRLRYHEELAGLAEHLVAQQGAQLELAEARLELAQAQAVAGLEEGAAEVVDVAGAQARVNRLVQVLTARQTEARALRRKLELMHAHLRAGSGQPPPPWEAVLTLPAREGAADGLPRRGAIEY